MPHGQATCQRPRSSAPWERQRLKSQPPATHCTSLSSVSSSVQGADNPLFTGSFGAEQECTQGARTRLGMQPASSQALAQNGCHRKGCISPKGAEGPAPGASAGPIGLASFISASKPVTEVNLVSLSLEEPAGWCPWAGERGRDSSWPPWQLDPHPHGGVSFQTPCRQHHVLGSAWSWNEAEWGSNPSSAPLWPWAAHCTFGNLSFSSVQWGQ